MIALVDPRERRARPWLPEAAPAWSFWIAPTGERVRVNADGHVTPIQPGGHPRGGAAADPCNTTRRR